MISKINTFFRFNNHKKTLIFQAFGLSVYTYILFTYFNRYAQFSKEDKEKNRLELTSGDECEQGQKTKDISWAIHLVSKNIPWKNVCRHQAYQAMVLCNFYKIPCQVFIGFKKDIEKNEIQAHAWSRASGYIITGFCNPEEYTVQRIYHNKWH